MDISVLPLKTRARLAAKKIEPQFIAGPDGKLMFAIVENALQSLTAAKTTNRKTVPCHQTRNAAKKYLKDDLIHAELAGCNKEWILSVLERLEINLQPDGE